MKNLFKLGNIIDFLPPELVDSVLKFAKDEEGIEDIDNLEVHRKGSREKKDTKLEEGSRSEITYVSSRRKDRADEVVVPGGMSLVQFKLSPQVYWNHNYSLPPIGSDDWIETDDFGIKAKTDYADTGEGTLANVLWHLIHQGHLNTSSIGFIPIKTHRKGDSDWDRVVRRLAGEWPEFEKQAASISLIFSKAILLEHSKVSVPENIDARTVQVAKSFGANNMILKDMGVSDELLTKKETKSTKQDKEPTQEISIVPDQEVKEVVQEYVEELNVKQVVKEVIELEAGRV